MYTVEDDATILITLHKIRQQQTGAGYMQARVARNTNTCVLDQVGANNVSLLFPSGQFGTRIQGGSLLSSVYKS